MGLSGYRVCVVLRLLKSSPEYQCTAVPHTYWAASGSEYMVLAHSHNLVFVVIVDENVDIWVVFLELWTKVLLEKVSLCLWSEMHSFILQWTSPRFILYCNSPYFHSLCTVG